VINSCLNSVDEAKKKATTTTFSPRSEASDAKLVEKKDLTEEEYIRHKLQRAARNTDNPYTW